MASSCRGTSMSDRPWRQASAPTLFLIAQDLAKMQVDTND